MKTRKEAYLFLKLGISTFLISNVYGMDGGETPLLHPQRTAISPEEESSLILVRRGPVRVKPSQSDSCNNVDLPSPPPRRP